MARFVLVPGAGGDAWYWHRLVPELRDRGHDAVPVDLPAADDDAGLDAYADAIEDVVTRHLDVVLVAQSMAGLSPLVCACHPVRLLVMLNAMVPAPGETGHDWWAVTGHEEALAEQATRDGVAGTDMTDLATLFFHDVPADVTAEAMARGEPEQSTRPFDDPWPLSAWPDVPTRVVQGADDRFFPLEFQRRVVRERLGIPVDVVPGGHLVALSRPVELAGQVEAYCSA